MNAHVESVEHPAMPDISGLEFVPASRPLSMPEQSFVSNSVSRPRPARSPQFSTRVWQIAAFVPALSMTLGLAYLFHDMFRTSGVSVLEWVVLFLVAFSLVWVALSVTISLVGAASAFARRFSPSVPPKQAEPITVALLAPIYNEDVNAVFANLKVIIEDIVRHRSPHTFALYILSDSNDDDVRLAELEATAQLRRDRPGDIPVYYRHRRDNEGRKAGNIADWCRRWGGAHEAFIVLDADSLMDARCIQQLADRMSADPDLGLLQSVPRLIGARSLFARAQSFANTVYGPALAAGLDKIYDRTNSYWGHNAIIRTRAFASSAGLPPLPGRAPLGGTIMSHDFVEAALLCRAGWSVEMAPLLRGSYEQSPESIIDYCLRDRRWCQGNLQHLRLLRTPGLRFMSRFHLFQGAIAYCCSLVWLALLTAWIGLSFGQIQLEWTYFSEENPLFPVWPVTHTSEPWLYMAVVYGMLLLPKLIGVAWTLVARPWAKLGGLWRFLTSALAETFMSVLIAPIMMIQQSLSIFRVLLGTDSGWKPQSREGSAYTFSQTLRFHRVETALGIALSIAILTGTITALLAPIALSLLLTVPLSMLTALPTRHWLLASEEDYAPPSVLKRLPA